MTYDQTPAPAGRPRRGNSTLVTGVVLLVIGAAAIIVGIVLTANAASTVLDNSKIGSAQTAPATFTSQLDNGTTYAIYQATQGGNTVQTGDIVVTGPSGPVTVTKTNGTVNTTGADNKTYVEVATFDPPTTGSYTIAIATKGSLVAVAPALSTAAKGVAWIVAVILGSVIAVIGLILIIIGAARRSSSRNNRQEDFGGAAGRQRPELTTFRAVRASRAGRLHRGQRASAHASAPSGRHQMSDTAADTTTPTWRIAPSVPVAIGVFIAYVVVVAGLASSSGIAFDDWFSSRVHLFRAAVIPLIGGSLVLVAFLLWARWDSCSRTRSACRCRGSCLCCSPSMCW